MKPFVSVITCSRNEEKGIAHFLLGLIQDLQGLDVEVLVVDDSTDSTPEIVSALSKELQMIRLIHRPNGERDGLGGAILRGLCEASGEYILSIDADGQHPTALIKQMVSVGAEIVVPTRFAEGGDAEGLSGWHRKVFSNTLRQLPRLLFPAKIGKVTDPLSGFFLIKRELIDCSQLKPESWKMLVEILATSPCATQAQIPYKMGSRIAGESKMSIKQGLLYFKHLISLRLRTWTLA